MSYETREQKVERLIQRGKDLKERLLPLWADYRQFYLDAARFNGEASPLCKVDVQQLCTPDVDFVLDLLLEQRRLITRQIEYSKHLDQLPLRGRKSNSSIGLSSKEEE